MFARARFGAHRGAQSRIGSDRVAAAHNEHRELTLTLTLTQIYLSNLIAYLMQINLESNATSDFAK